MRLAMRGVAEPLFGKRAERWPLVSNCSLGRKAGRIADDRWSVGEGARGQEPPGVHAYLQKTSVQARLAVRLYADMSYGLLCGVLVMHFMHGHA